MQNLNIKRLLVDIILIVGIFIAIFIGYKIYNKSDNSTPEQLKQTLIENKKIQDKIDSISRYNKSLMNRIYSLEVAQTDVYDVINQNNSLIKENTNKLDKLKKSYEEKIDSVNNYSIYQLDSFFTKRYP